MEQPQNDMNISKAKNVIKGIKSINLFQVIKIDAADIS